MNLVIFNWSIHFLFMLGFEGRRSRQSPLYEPVNKTEKSYEFDKEKTYCENIPLYIEYKKQKILSHLTKDFPKEFFVCHGVSNVPLIKVDKSYFLKYPCDEDMCKKLIQDSERAPFGRGESTIVDSTIRDTWQVNKKIQFLSTNILDGANSNDNEILKDINAKLCPGCSSIRAEFYKMLVYEKGSHFKAHKDTIRGNQHFGSLVIFLPSFYSGGEFKVRHLGEEQEYQYSLTEENFDLSKCHWVAFYTDCEHEIKPLLEGNRVVLTYHLFYEGKNAPKILEESNLKLIQDMQLEHDEILDLIEGNSIGMLLSHEYSMETLKFDTLKGMDAVYYSTFSRNPKYDVKLVAVKISVEGSEEYMEDADVEFTIGDNNTKTYLLNDYEDLNLRQKDYRSNETGNEGTSVSFHYSLGAILIKKSESTPNPKKFRIDIDEFKEKVNDLFEEEVEEFEESQKLENGKDIMVIENSKKNLLRSKLDVFDLQNELVSIVRRSSNNIHVITFILHKITKSDVTDNFKRYISFLSLLLLGFLFKSKEELNETEIQQLKECKSISFKYSNVKETTANNNWEKDAVYHFSDCLNLLETNFESKEILGIIEGKMELNAKESCELLKLRIIELYRMRKFREYKNLSQYFTKTTLKKNHPEILDAARFLTPYSQENAFILYMKYMMVNYSPYLADELLQLISSLNMKREEQRDTLFNVCIETLADHLFKNYSGNWDKASEILINLADEQISFLSFNLFLHLFQQRNQKFSVNSEIQINRISQLHKNGQYYMAFHLFKLNIKSIEGNETLMKEFLQCAKSPEEIRLIYEVVLPSIENSNHQKKNHWHPKKKKPEEIISLIFFNSENRSVSADYLHVMLNKKEDYYKEDVGWNTILDNYMETEYYEKLMTALTKTMNPSLSLYVAEKNQHNPKCKESLLKHLNLLLNSFQIPTVFGNDCKACKEVYEFLISDEEATQYTLKNESCLYLNIDLSRYKYQQLTSNKVGRGRGKKNVMAITKHADVRTILSKLRRIQNKLSPKKIPQEEIIEID
jgi:hypothetical protein